MDKVLITEKLLVDSDYNCHVCSDMGCFEETHGVLELGK